MFQKAVVLKLTYKRLTNMLIMVTSFRLSDSSMLYVKLRQGFKQLVEALRLDFERHLYD